MKRIVSRLMSLLLVLGIVGILVYGISRIPSASATSQPISFVMRGHVRAAQVVAAGTETEVHIFTYVGMDADDGNFVQLEIHGADMRFGQGLHLEVKYHPSTDYYGPVIDDVKVLK
jgi:hypothetical protein